MSILIKGMEIPDKCINCPFMVSRDNDDCILQSEAANGRFETWDDMKAECPLVEVPYHKGRLLDEREVKQARGELKYNERGKSRIEVSDILNYFKDIDSYYNDCTRYDTLKRMLEDIVAETKEDAERKTGKWIPSTYRYVVKDGEFPKTEIIWQDATSPDDIEGMRCSECGTVFDFTEARNWCSECGADMRGEQDG